MNKPFLMIARVGVLACLLAVGALGNWVTFDTTFNGTGYRLHPVVTSPQYAFGQAMVMQPDGKIVLAGETIANSQRDKFGLMRLNSDGGLDTSFGSGGSVALSINVSPHATQVLLQPDGKILIGGYTWTDATAYNFTIVRFTSTGELDTSFNGTGHVSRNVSGASWDYGNDMVLQPDGKIVMVGSSSSDLTTQKDIVIMRFNDDGSLDTTFNGTGVVTAADPSINELGESIMLLPGGKILIGGLGAGGSRLMRFESNGTLDTSFGTGGITNTGPGTSLKTIGLQSDGKIVAGGDGRFARYSADGILDTSFGVAGVRIVDTETGRLKVDANDKIVIAAKFGANGGAVRLTKTGALDTHFNGPNQANIHVPSSGCFTSSVLVANDGKILLGGNCAVNLVPQFAVYRLKETRTKRSLDFAGDGWSDLATFRPSTTQWWHIATIGFSQPSVLTTFGQSTDLPIPADFTGDGRTDFAVFRPSTGQWLILQSETGTTISIPFGVSGDIPLGADYDGDDIADLAVFRPSTNVWYIQKSGGGDVTTMFGAAGDKPVPGDYDGDFKTDIAIFRPSNGQWWMQRSSDSSVLAFQFGTSTDILIRGDYTGDHATDAAYFRPSTGEWFVLRSEDFTYYSAPFGLDGDIPLPAQYFGDARYDLVVLRPSTNRVHFWWAPNGPYFHTQFETAGDVMLANTVVP